MDYEQKYAKALWQMKELYDRVKYLSSTEALLVSQTIEKAFPELKESEDERIRKFLIDYINARCWYDKFPYKQEQVLAWLEKQGEQEWSEEDELNLKQAIYVCHQNGYTAVENWLKSIKPNHWKPSEEQMNSLLALSVLHKESKALESLYNDLKKL